MTPDGRLVVKLPGDRPRVHSRFREELHDLVPVPHRVHISTLAMGVCIVWHAAWLPTHPLPLRTLRPDEGMAAMLEGVEALVDGSAIAPLGSEGV